MPDNEKIARLIKYASRLFKPEELIEYRAKMADGSMRGFYFTDLQRYAEVVDSLDSSERAMVSYICINPLKGRLIRERGLLINPTDEQVNQIIAGPAGQTAKNDDIDVCRWLFIDVDTNRAPQLKATDKDAYDKLQHECSTKEEKAAGLEVVRQVKEFLRTEKEWPEPIVCDSGNGFHILFRIELQNTQTNVHVIADVLKTLKTKFDCDAADIDASVFNPARLTRAYGSTTRKGTNTEERPWRPNYMFEQKVPLGNVTLDMLLNLAVESPSYSKHSGDDMPALAEGFDPDDFIKHYTDQKAFTIEGQKDWSGHPILATDHCLFQGKKHSGDDFKSGFVIGDTFGYCCFSSDCDGLRLSDAIKALTEQGFEPYDQPIYEDDKMAVAQTVDELLEDGDIVAAEKGEAVDKQIDVATKDAAMQSRKPAPPLQVIVEEDTLLTPEENVALQFLENQLAEEVPQTSGTVNQTVEREIQAYATVSEAAADLDVKINANAKHLLSVMFHHPEVWQDGFMFFMKRIKTKLGFDKKYKKPEEGEAEQQTLAMPMGEIMRLVIKFAETNKRLPDKETFTHWLDVSTDHSVAKNDYKVEMTTWISKLKDKPAATFDITAVAFVDRLDFRAECDAWREAFNFHLMKQNDVVGARMALRKHFNISTTQDAGFEQGAWQERTDAIYADFQKNIDGVDDARKFKLGFRSIDQSGMNIGLDGDHAICLCGPASNRKTTATLSIAMNFAIQGKNVLFFAGEHQCMKVLKRLTLQLSHFFKDDPDIGHIPGLSKWEGLNRTATAEDLTRIKALLLKLKSRNDVPGYIEPQNVGAVARGEEDKVGALLQYAEATFPKYQWDAIFIDPLDSIMPPETGANKGASNWKVCSGIVDRLFEFSRNGFGGRGCMMVVTAQFGSEARRDIERIQEKNAGMENFDDEIESILKRDGLIQYFTTIGQRFDLCLGVATRTKDGTEGLLVRGRDREGGIFNSCHFHVDPDTNYMTQKPVAYEKREPEQAAAAVAAAQQTMENIDDL